jgi:hypothetical protein
MINLRIDYLSIYPILDYLFGLGYYNQLHASALPESTNMMRITLSYYDSI